jgi:hypothetical protein
VLHKLREIFGALLMIASILLSLLVSVKIGVIGFIELAASAALWVTGTVLYNKSKT